MLRPENKLHRRAVLKGLLATPLALPSFIEVCKAADMRTLLKQTKLECKLSEMVQPRDPLKVEVIPRNDVNDLRRALFEYSQPDVEIVDIRAYESEMTARRQIHAGHKTYIISPITERDIVSRDYFDCTGVVFVGKEIGADGVPTEKEISFKTHEDPGEMLYKKTGGFIADFNTQLDTFLKRVDPNSVAYGFFGGNYSHGTAKEYRGRKGDASHSAHYVRSIMLLAKLTMRRLPHLEPQVILGSNISGGPVHFRLKTQERTVLVLGPSDTPSGFSVCNFQEYLKTLEERLR